MSMSELFPWEAYPVYLKLGCKMYTRKREIYRHRSVSIMVSGDLRTVSAL